MKITIRLPYTNFDHALFDATIAKIRTSIYKVGAKDDEAPKYTDCITSVRWILRNSTDIVIPLTYIGDMPNSLILELGSDKIPLQNARKGDLIFFERMSFTHKKYMVAHMGIMISEKEFFHSSLHFGGGKISSLEDSEYNNSILDESFLSLAHDPRNYA